MTLFRKVFAYDRQLSYNLFTLLLLFCSLLPQPLQAQTATPVDTPIAATNSSAETSNTPTATPTVDQLTEQRIQEYINTIFEAMSPADRVGQLFVITFEGDQITRNSDIVELVHQGRIGGIVISPANHNFTNRKGENTPEAVARLVNQLQALTYGYLVMPNQSFTLPLTSSLPFSGSVPLAAIPSSPRIPLLIGVEQLGDGYPTTALRRGFTTLPSQMALGATWNPLLVQEVGKIVGQELNAVGINLLLGPNLDVVDEPRTDPVGALGLHSFGGDPYWVSQMGRAYIAGVHNGSTNRVATIARHFPGQGNIDRFPNQQVATVQKSLTELRDIALPPFSSVTRQSSPLLALGGDPAATDGLMTSHMRFSALQGASPGRTTPISLMLDLKRVLNDEGLGQWHNTGGIVMTNGLGLPAIRRYYDATLREFPYKSAALDAFDAGHDLLYLANLSTDGSWNTEKQYLQEILQFFRERYEGETEFRVQVDHAVKRILRLKYGLYQQDAVPPASTTANVGETTVQTLIPPVRVLRQRADLAIFAEDSLHRTETTTIIGQVTHAAMTLLYPDVQNLSPLMRNAPQADDQVLIFSDSQLYRECEGCIAETALGPEELKEITIRLFGSEPGATDKIDPQRVYGRSFSELAILLDVMAANANQQLTTTLPTTTTLSSGPVTDAEIIPTPINSTTANNNSAPFEGPLTPDARLQRLIDDSTWIIFAMLDVDPVNKPGSDVVKRFLSQQSEQLDDKRVIVLALNAPYFLDATEISKLTAYFGVYSKTQPFLESAIRAIFRSSSPPGAPPVSVPGTRFNSLVEQLRPDPDHALQLTVYLDDTPLNLSETMDTTDTGVTIGDALRLEVSNILDHNGHPVPDGVEVEFHLVDEARQITVAVNPVVTRNGSATTQVVMEQPGHLLLSASAGEAKTSVPLAMNVRNSDDLVVIATTVVTPTAPLSQSVLLTTTPALAATSPLTITDPIEPLDSAATEGVGDINVTTLAIAFLTILVTLSLLLILQIRILPRHMLLQNMLWATIFGLSSYILYGLGLLPGIPFLQMTLRFWGAAVVVFIGMLLPLLWLQLRAE